MSGKVQYAESIRIPDLVLKSLDAETLALLAKDRHGVSFPNPTGCQLRFIREGKDLGGSYSYRQYGGVKKAVKAAMSRCQQLRVVHPAKAHAPKGNVCWYECLDKRNDKVEYGYRVFYQRDGRTKAKAFSFGYHRPSPDKQLHGYRSAKLFRHFFELYENDFDQQWFKQWKEVRLYDKAQGYFDWKNT